MFKKYQTANNINTCFYYAHLPGLLLACAVFFLSPPLHAGKNGATIIPVTIKTSGFPDTAEEIEKLLHYQEGVVEPWLYYKAARQWLATELTPERLKHFYGKIPVRINYTLHDEVPSPITLPEKVVFSKVIDMIESDEHHYGIAISAIFDEETEAAFRHAFKEVKKAMRFRIKRELENLSSLEDLEPELEGEAFSPSLLLTNYLEPYFELPKATEKREKVLKTWPHTELFYLKLPPQVMTLHVANKYYFSELLQPLNNTSQIIIQSHGMQKCMLMSPDHVYTSPHLFDKDGRFNCPDIDLSAPEDVLRNEKRLANITLYSVVLSPGDILVIPANWFIHRQSLFISISATFTYFSDDLFPLAPQAKFIRQNQKAVMEWAKKSAQKHPENFKNIFSAAETINASIDNGICQPHCLDPVLNLKNLELYSLPEEITYMGHIKHLSLRGNRLTEFFMHNIKNLESLDLSHNRLTAASITHMENLTSLDLSHNQLTTPSIAHIKNLTSLDLSHNQLTIAFITHMENLTSLDLSHNLLQQLYLNNLEKLASLNLYKNEITLLETSYLPCINVIDLRANHLVAMEKSLISFMMNTDNFLWLDLKDNPLSEDCVRQIQIELLFRKGANHIIYPVNAHLLPEEQLEEAQLLVKTIRNKAMPCSSFITLLEEKGVFPLPELHCPVTKTVPDQAVFLKQFNIYKIYDADALLECFRAKLLLGTTALLENPMTRMPVKPEDITSPSEYLLLPVTTASGVKR